MSNGFISQNVSGGISFTSTPYVWGTTQPAVNSGFNFDVPLASAAAFANGALTFQQNNSDSNRAFLSSVIGQASSNVNATSQQASSYQQSALQLFGNINSSVSSTVNKAVKGATGCYITTAICEAEGKPDNCDELQTFRRFRDTYMQESIVRVKLVKRYYKTAPAIVAAINARSDAKEIYALLRDGFLNIALRAIKKGDNEMALEIYQNMVNVAATFIED